jgi:hypothetical protein
VPRSQADVQSRRLHRLPACPTPAQPRGGLTPSRRSTMAQVAQVGSGATATNQANSNAGASSAATCPFSALKATVSGVLQPATSSSPSFFDVRSATTPIPGPPPFSWQALQDVSIIFTQGLHVAMLRFSEKYGSTCR